MNSRLTADFRKHFDQLPLDVQQQARVAFRQWKDDPYQTGLHFKLVSQTYPLHSVRIGQHWRALALKDDNTLDWFWIGPHSHYDRLLDKFR